MQSVCGQDTRDCTTTTQGGKQSACSSAKKVAALEESLLSRVAVDTQLMMDTSKGVDVATTASYQRVGTTRCVIQEHSDSGSDLMSILSSTIVQSEQNVVVQAGFHSELNG